MVATWGFYAASLDALSDGLPKCVDTRVPFGPLRSLRHPIAMAMRRVGIMRQHSMGKSPNFTFLPFVFRTLSRATGDHVLPNA